MGTSLDLEKSSIFAIIPFTKDFRRGRKALHVSMNAELLGARPRGLLTIGRLFDTLAVTCGNFNAGLNGPHIWS